jgi:hypothetical protein
MKINHKNETFRPRLVKFLNEFFLGREKSQAAKRGMKRTMPNRVHILRFFRDTEARLRELAQQDPADICSGLLHLADEISIQATELKNELIAERLIR